MTNLDTTIEKMQNLVNRLDQTIMSARDLTEDQIQTLLESDEFKTLIKANEELNKAFDNALGENK